MGWCMGRPKKDKPKINPDDNYIIFTGQFMLKQTDIDCWVGSIKNIQQAHRVTGKQLIKMAEELDEYEE